MTTKSSKDDIPSLEMHLKDLKNLVIYRIRRKGATEEEKKVGQKCKGEIT